MSAVEVRFICGCRYDLSAVPLDVEGFVVCPAHNQRRYGWRSVPYTATTMTEPGMATWTEYEYEQYVLYDIVPGRVEAEPDKVSEPERVAAR